MQPLERAGMLAHARSKGYGRRMERALACLHDARDKRLSPYISFSGGKDSTAMLFLVRQVFPAAPAVFADDEFHLPETLELLEQIPNLTRVAGKRQHAEWFTAWSNGAEGLPEGTVWIEGEVDSRMATWARSQGLDAVCIGIRADESRYRNVHIRTMQKRHESMCFYVEKLGSHYIYPCAFLTLKDVWATIVVNDLPYNRAYHRLAELGVPFEKRRIGPFAVQSVLPQGQMGILKAGWPEEFERFAERYPEARGYV